MDQELLGHTAQIVSAHLINNPVPPDRIPSLIREVYSTLTRLGANANTAGAAPEPLTPAVPIRKSVTQDYIVCLEDGRKFKMLKRHLAATYNMTPDEYRKRWGLPDNYPMVAPAYADTRSTLAKESGLGRGGRQSAAPAKSAPVAQPVQRIPEGKRGVGRPRKNAA